MDARIRTNAIEFAVAVFAIAGDPSGRFVLFALNEDSNESAAANAVARGYSFAGSIAVADGVPAVTIEPGFEGAVVLAGARFAEMLGVRLQRRHLAVEASIEA